MNSVCDQRINEWAVGVVSGFVGGWSRVRPPVREPNGVAVLPRRGTLGCAGLRGAQQLLTGTCPHVLSLLFRSGPVPRRPGCTPSRRFTLAEPLDGLKVNAEGNSSRCGKE